MKEDVCFEPLPVAVAAGLLHKQLNATVDAFGQGIAKAMLEDTDDTGKMWKQQPLRNNFTRQSP